MGQAKQKRDAAALYLASVAGIACPSCGADGFDVVDLETKVIGFHEPGIPDGQRYVCGRCLTEWE